MWELRFIRLYCLILSRNVCRRHLHYKRRHVRQQRSRNWNFYKKKKISAVNQHANSRYNVTFAVLLLEILSHLWISPPILALQHILQAFCSVFVENFTQFLLFGPESVIFFPCRYLRLSVSLHLWKVWNKIAFTFSSIYLHRNMKYVACHSCKY